jgi:hypothetical protein
MQRAKIVILGTDHSGNDETESKPHTHGVSFHRFEAVKSVFAALDHRPERSLTHWREPMEERPKYRFVFPPGGPYKCFSNPATRKNSAPRSLPVYHRPGLRRGRGAFLPEARLSADGQSNTRRKISRRVNQGRQALANRAGANLAEPFAALRRPPSPFWRVARCLHLIGYVGLTR